MKMVLGDHEAGICAGPHADMDTGRGDASGTIWSLIAEPARRLVKVAEGHPCICRYAVIEWP